MAKGDKCKFLATMDQCQFITKTNGDMVYFQGVHLDKDNAVALTSLISEGKTLKIVITEKEE